MRARQATPALTVRPVPMTLGLPTLPGAAADRLIARVLSLEVALGALLGLYVLVGRWSPLRLAGADDAYLQVRFAILAGLAALLPVLVFRHPRFDAVFIRRVLLPVLAFIAYMTLTIAWTPMWEAALPKAVDLALILLVALATAPLVRRSDPEKLAWAFWSAVVVITGVNALLVILSGASALASGDRLTPLGGGPNVFARMMGLLCIGAGYFGMKTRAALPWMAVAALAVLLVLASGSRGGLLALPVALIALWARSRVGRVRALTVAILAAATVALFAAYTETGASALETFDRRIRQLTFEERYDSGRTAIFERALQMGFEQPVLGAGLDAFQQTDFNGLYQHNLVLEAFSEGGTIALVLLLWLAIAALRDAVAASSVEGLAYGAAFVMIGVGSQVSGDVFDSRALFLLPLLLAGALAPRALRAGRPR